MKKSNREALLNSIKIVIGVFLASLIQNTYKNPNFNFIMGTIRENIIDWLIISLISGTVGYFIFKGKSN